MKLTTVTRLDAGEIRAVCIKQDWCFQMTNEEYSAMLDKADKLDISETDKVLEIAEDIFKHSDPEGMMRQYNATEAEAVENICCFLLNDCAYTMCFVE